MAKQGPVRKLFNNMLTKKEAVGWAVAFYLLGHFTGDDVVSLVKALF